MDAMCGIVGLFLKDAALEPELGHLLSGMLGTMCDRGPDSAGFAVYGAPKDGLAKITVQSADARRGVRRTRRCARRGDIGADGVARAQEHACGARACRPDKVEAVRACCASGIRRCASWASGDAIEIYKEVGHPNDGGASASISTG